MAAPIIRKFFHTIYKIITPPVLDGQEAQDAMISLLKSDKPCMIGRFGSVEIQATLWSILPPPISTNYLKNKCFNGLFNNAGFFPVTTDNVRKFGKLMIESMKECDCLASWRFEEAFFKKYLKKSIRIRLGCLGPDNKGFENSWYGVLKGKKILVISPFAELILDQYNNHRTEIWDNPTILPQYASLSVIKAVNSLRGKCQFSSWFEAFYYMKNQIDRIDFDIAILGCGAYGFPLAAYIKSIGKKAIHVGGSTQLIFGIKGKRWEDRDFINSHWVSPRPQDRPIGYESVEGGCYW